MLVDASEVKDKTRAMRNVLQMSEGVRTSIQNSQSRGKTIFIVLQGFATAGEVVKCNYNYQEQADFISRMGRIIANSRIVR